MAESQSLALTYWLRLVRKHSIHLRILALMLIFQSFKRTKRRETVSKAFFEIYKNVVNTGTIDGSK